MTKIYLIRHAEAEGNLYRIAHGQEEGLITDYRGPRQMQALARRFRDIPVDAVYASDLIRTRTTAQSIYLPKGLQLHPDPAFREICMGEWEEHCWYELLRKYPQSHYDFNHRLDRWQVPGSETARQVLDRYLPALRRVARQHDGQTVAVFSLEMSRDQLVTRLLASEGLIENTRLISGDLRESDWVKIAEGASSLSRLDIRIDDNPLLTVADMNAKCRRIDNLGLVVIDYLQLMTSAGGKGYSGENRQQAVSDISRMLKIMAKELQVPVLCLSQLSRANEKREDKRPMLSDLRESGAIEQDADIVMFLYRDDYYKEDSEKRNIAECIVAKNRHGETGKVELRWMPDYTAFSTLENRYEE